MGVGYIILPFIILLFYLIPVGIIIFTRISKKAKLTISAVPVCFTALFILVVAWDNNQTSKLYERLPQANTLTFRNSNSAVQDSIIELKHLLKKLPPRRDHGSVGYSIDKYPNSYGQFNFNWTKLGDFKSLTKSNDLRNFHLTEPSEWGTQDKTPFDTLTPKEAKQLVTLIEYLDYNYLNGAVLNSIGEISLSYNDSLRVIENIGFRKVVLDTTKSFSPNRYHCFDNQGDIFLVKRINN